MVSLEVILFISAPAVIMWNTTISKDMLIIGFFLQSQLDAVVKVFCIMAKPDFASPWGREQEESYSTGLIVSGRKVLTTAHSVDHHTLVKLKKHNCDTMYTATMLAIAPECDLGMIYFACSLHHLMHYFLYC